MLPPDADELAKFRFNICQELLKYARKHDLTAVEMAKFLEITKADMKDFHTYLPTDEFESIQDKHTEK